MDILQLREADVTSDVVEAFHRLVPQLSSSAPALSEADLRSLVRAEAITVFVAIADERIVGTLTLALFPIPTGIRAWIEDVVVDHQARGQGIGQALTRRALLYARERGARTVDLTSRPSRDAANAMYTELGFTQRDTNVYRYDLTGDA